jgi:hypothetical protein
MRFFVVHQKPRRWTNDPPDARENAMKSVKKMKKISIRRTGDIRLTAAAPCGTCYCAFV